MSQNDVTPQNSVQTKLPKQVRRFALAVLPMLAVLHIYIGWRLLPALNMGALATAIGVILLILSTLVLPMGMILRFTALRQPIADRISWASALTMGLFSSVFMLTVLRDMAQLIVWSPLFSALKAQTFTATTAQLVLPIATLVTFIGLLNARRIARVVKVDIHLENLPTALTDFTIVQISDIHVGATIKGDYVRAIVNRVNSLNADMIAITGDVVDGSVEQLSSDTAHLSNLKARHGAYVVTGNHEYYSGATEWMAEFKRLGLHGLMNEHVVIEHDGAQLVIAGVTDYSAHAFDLMQRSDPEAALLGSPDGVHRILLAHQPRSASAAASAGFHLQLSGHTHGGQFWPWNLFVRIQQPFTAGLHRLGQLWVYTSRGTGYWGPPKRFGVHSEITLLRLRANS